MYSLCTSCCMRPGHSAGFRVHMSHPLHIMWSHPTRLMMMACYPSSLHCHYFSYMLELARPPREREDTFVGCDLFTRCHVIDPPFSPPTNQTEAGGWHSKRREKQEGWSGGCQILILLAVFVRFKEEGERVSDIEFVFFLSSIVQPTTMDSGSRTRNCM
jgi:hypothetical protein